MKRKVLTKIAAYRGPMNRWKGHVVETFLTSTGQYYAGVRPDTERSRCVLDRPVKTLLNTMGCENGSQSVSGRGRQCVRERSPAADKETAKNHNSSGMFVRYV